MTDKSFRAALRRGCIGGHLAALGLVSILVITASATIASAIVPSPTVEGPVTGGKGSPFAATTNFDLTQVGYTQQEYFISGTASAYSSADTFASNGKWTATTASSAPYKTRILVYMPIKPNKFKGTVVVEWLNVSGGVDAGPDWTLTHTELIRDGYAWVGVSAQAVGVEGGTTIFGTPSIAPLKTYDPARYGSLSHPGDSFSYDIFSQAGEAIRHPTGVSPLGTLKLKTVLAAGDSQSAFRLVTYINAIHQSAAVYDGFLVHSRGNIGAPLSQSPQPAINVFGSTPVRDDLDVPVLLLETETDLVGLNYFSARQPDSAMIRVWEMAGTAHADVYGLGVGPADAGKAAIDTTYSDPVDSIAGVVTCGLPINAGPQHYIESAAIWALNRWVQKGTPPAHAPSLTVVAGTPPVITRDAHGNALGGIRTPQVDVPIATLSGGGQTGSSFCFLFGTTTPFDSITLASLYPKHSKYVSAVKKAKNVAVKGGFILKVDAAEIATAAAKSTIGN